MTIRLPKDVARGFRVSAFVEGISQSDLMLRLARDHLAKHPPPPLMPPAEQARKVREYKRTSSRKK